jgi:tetratricopeptide (TPR) repeat protein
MVRRSCIAAVFFFVFGLFAPASAGDVETCQDQNALGPQAVAACTRIISNGRAEGTQLAETYYDRGQKHRINGKLDAAIDDYTNAIRILPNWNFPYVARGHAYAKKGEFERAFADQDVAIRLEPTAVSYVGRAMDLIEAGKLDRAIADLDEALRLDPRYFFAYLSRGDLHLKRRDFDKALSDYRMAVEIGTPSEISMQQARDGVRRATNRVTE